MITFHMWHSKFRFLRGIIMPKSLPASGINIPPPPKKRTERHLLDLGVDINDVWAVAVAWEHGLIFVTEDKMACIREAVGSDVQFECWTQQHS